MVEIRIDVADPSDLPRLIAVRYAALAAQAPSAYSATEVETLLGDVDEDELRRMIRDRQLFVARVGTEVVGLAGWRGDRVRHVYVDPDLTRRGIASRLLQRVEADYQDRTGADEVRVGVALHAKPFYAANGYRLVEQAAAWDGSAYLRMAKPLTPAYVRRSARVLVVDSADRVLLIRSLTVAGDPHSGHIWLTPGGGVEPGESLPAAAVRELAEELGLRAAAEELTPVAYSGGHADLWLSGLFRDDFFLHRVTSHEVDPAGLTELERSHYAGYRWWTVADLGATTETVYPFGLAELLAEIVAGRPPVIPVELPWHHG
ncbi:GNAT family N-acetyltransferase [Plantactinospora sp. GCM10030261]|uniref:GNAT family N-acetyltransferase n=1 Tax=Plantactinospora sp. GCM10030261 TaxID=3273420 RepID=UPI003606711B